MFFSFLNIVTSVLSVARKFIDMEMIDIIFLIISIVKHHISQRCVSQKIERLLTIFFFFSGGGGGGGGGGFL